MIHGYTAPWVAGYVLAQLITGLPAALVDLIAGDQITDDAILGCAVPDRAQAVLRALDTHHEAALQGPAGPTYEPPSAKPHSSRSHAEQLFAAAVAWLLNGRAASILERHFARLRSPLSSVRFGGLRLRVSVAGDDRELHESRGDAEADASGSPTRVPRRAVRV